MSDLSTIIQGQSMNSLKIAKLVEVRHDSVKRAIERLVERGVIQLPPLVEVNNKQSVSANNKTMAYVFTGPEGKRDSIVVVAQLCPEFTARLVDRWAQLEAEVAKPAFDPAKLSRLDLLQMALKAEEERLGLADKVEELRPDRR